MLIDDSKNKIDENNLQKNFEISPPKTIFEYKGNKIIIPCKNGYNMKEVCKKFAVQVGKSINQLFFLYDGGRLKEELTFQEVNKDKEKNAITILAYDLDEKAQINDNKRQKEVICPNCGESILVRIKDYKINLYNCKNGHKFENILINEYISLQKKDESKIICSLCKENKNNTYNNEFYKCCLCEINLCPLCKNIHNKKHENIVNYDLINFICIKHNDNYIKFCNKCGINICISCQNDHIGHDIMNFRDLMPNKDNIINILDELKNKLDSFKNISEDIKNKINNIKFNKNNEDSNKIIDKIIENLDIYYKISFDIIKNYQIIYINFQLIKNIIEFNDYNNIIINDLNRIINENNEDSRFQLIIEIYNKMFNTINEYENKIIGDKTIKFEYKEKIIYKFQKDPKNLKYKYDITNSNDKFGANDIFEVFTSYKDNKEYLVSKNNNNYNLDIFNLIDNKKILSLEGHKNHIITIRYFINNQNNKEYLISGDEIGIVIIWNISKDFHIKYKIKTQYEEWVYSSLMVFLNNKNNGYIITSTCNIANNIEISGTKIYSLNDGKFKKYINGTNKYDIRYLLSWYNKKNNEYYIVQLANKIIIINNLLKDVLYSKLIKEPESYHNSGFIFSRNNNDYLCSSSQNGFINIWDLYNKNIFKIIDTNNLELFHIIEWNEKYFLAAERKSTSFKIIDLENNIILSNINEQHIAGIICIKKIYHSLYGETLFSSGMDKTIKIWT